MIKLKIPKNVMEGAEPFEHSAKGSKKAALLLHGLTGTPSEMRYLGERLNGEGYHVFAPLHPGHGTSIKELNRTRWEEIYESVEKIFKEIRGEFKDLFVAGLSMGGLLTLKLAIDYGDDIRGAASLSTPMRFAEWKARALLPVAAVTGLMYLIPDVPKTIQDVADKSGDTHVCYDHDSVRATVSIVKLMKLVRSNLSKINTPLLIMQSKIDSVVAFESVDIIYNGVSSAIKERAIVEKSLHTITVDVEKEVVADAVVSFFNARG
ncbi:MAG: alpha/beta fold hydrolase [Deltaproteobacteria bacterium]|uniref:Alpha/beta fold hydrolase n=1 Tax=Candidatus Zymogenus saltonus TaxID=2844893 RepID=A0A9D8KCL6_9DELT|nr:alpha/beta fold hydrolase [Candidatus Zymogenus saltonus]